MFKKSIITLLLLLPVLSFSQDYQYPDKKIRTIAFGSCNSHQRDQNIWGSILEHNPDLWVWLGDNIYADTENMQVMKKKYDAQKNHPQYQEFINQCMITGTWDDHDYGKNDAGKEYPEKEASQQLFLDFIGISEDSPQRDREGVYTSYLFGDGKDQIKLIILDTRYFRDPLKRENNGYVPTEGTMLGKNQWKWLEEELENSNAPIHVIASSIQAIPSEHPYEKWENFPKERQKLMDLLSKHQNKHTIILIGDRHKGEISAMEIDGNIIYEVTSSSLTHSLNKPSDEPNQFRKGKIIVDENFGLIQIDDKGEINLSLINEENQEVERLTLP